MTTHQFDTTGEAYDATQCFEEIKTGDILVIESERVVGIADTWPVAVTKERGHLHAPAEGVTLVECFERRKVTPDHVAAAKRVAHGRGWPVRA